MADNLIAVLMWIVALVAALLWIQPVRGREWWPTGKKQKMILTLLNCSVLVLVVVFLNEALLYDLAQTAIISGIVLIVLAILALPTIVARMSERSRRKKAGEELVLPAKCEECDPLKEYLQRILTAFNGTFFVLQVGYIAVEEIFFSTNCPETVENFQIVSFTVLFWSALVGMVLTALDWKYSDLLPGSAEKKQKEEADYFTRKIGRRNR